MQRYLLIVLLSISMCCQAQDGWKYTGNLNLGCNINFYLGKGQSFPGMRLYVGFIANAVYKDNFILNYGPSLSIYTKTVGANLNPLVNDIQIDLINSVSVGGGGGDETYVKYLRTMGNGSYYNLLISQAYAGVITSNFIVNNHHHNQVNAAVTISTPYATLNYYNDGGWPIPFPFSDNFDRYWTGGGGIFVHSDKNYNIVEFTFDQFTGYKPFVYELATKIGIDIPNYNFDEGSTTQVAPDYNTSQYNLRVCPALDYGIDIGAIGSLKSKKGTYWGIQEIIHTLGGYALHPNYDVTRFYFGGSYNNFSNVKL